MSTYATTFPRALLGLVSGVVTGATLVTLWSFAGSGDVHPNLVSEAAFVFTFAAAFWATGLTIVAALPWLCLDHYGLRGWTVAVALGVVLTFLVVIAILTNGFGLLTASGSFSAADNGGATWIDGRITPHGWATAFQFSAVCAAIGGIVGLAVWRTAYRRVR